MKRLILIFTLFTVLLISSCGIGKDGVSVGEENKEPFNTDTSGSTLYIVNTSTRSYHLPSCYIVNNMKDENKAETYDINFLVEREYTPCKICIDKN